MQCKVPPNFGVAAYIEFAAGVVAHAYHVHSHFSMMLFLLKILGPTSLAISVE
jgi:hypothetical protein